MHGRVLATFATLGDFWADHVSIFLFFHNTDGPRRLTTLPIEHPDLWKFYKKAVASFWTAERLTWRGTPKATPS